MKQKHLVVLAFIAGILTVLATPGTVSPQGTGVTVSVIDTNATKFPEVVLNVAVLDANGKLIPDLTPQNFTVIENTRPISPTSASAFFKPENRISVCLVLDVSATMGRVSDPATNRNFIDDVKQSANAFLDSGLASDDQVCIVAFSDKIGNINTPTPPKELMLTNNKNDPRNLIASLAPDQQSGKPLYDAVLKATKIATVAPAGSRAVIVIAEGRDERLAPDGTTILPGSDTTAQRTIDAAKEARIPIYTIGIGNDIDATYLKRLSEATGGDYSQPKPGQLDNLGFTNIVNRLKTQYAVSYTSQLTADGTDQAIQIRAKTASNEAETQGVIHLPSIVPPTPWLLYGLGALAVILIGIILLVLLTRRSRSETETIASPPITAAPPPTPIFPVYPAPAPPPPQGTDRFTGAPTVDTSTTGEERGEVPSPKTVFLEKEKPISLVFLVMEHGDHPGKEFPVRSESTTIGRSGENDVPVSDPTVGRRQAKIKLEGRDYYLYDLADTNPTRVNDKPVRGRVRLNEKDRIQMGDTVFVFMQIKTK